MAKYRVEQTAFRADRGEWSVIQFFPATTAGVIEWMRIGGIQIGATEFDVLSKYDDLEGSVSFCATILRDYGCIGRTKMFDKHMVSVDKLEEIELELKQSNKYLVELDIINGINVVGRYTDEDDAGGYKIKDYLKDKFDGVMTFGCSHFELQEVEALGYNVNWGIYGSKR